MFSFDTKIRVRYADTDRMGYLYHGNIATYLEVGRVEALRSIGLSYKALEDSGVALPVLELTSKFIKPAFYDDEITVRTMIKSIPSVRMLFEYELYNQDNILINISSSTLVFFDIPNKKPCLPPAEMLNALAPFFPNTTLENI
jgi:acyl-CoA thioester hydrolase